MSNESSLAEELAKDYQLSIDVAQQALDTAAAEVDQSADDSEFDVVDVARGILWRKHVANLGVKTYIESPSFERKRREVVASANAKYEQPELAEDCVQQVFLDVLLRSEQHPLLDLSRYSTEDHWWGYIYVSAIRKLRRKLGRLGREQEYSPDQITSSSLRTGPPSGQEWVEVMDWLDTFSELEFEVVLKRLEGNNYSQTAKALGVSRKRVREIAEKVRARARRDLGAT